MRRDLADPRDAGVSERDVGLETPRHGVSDESYTFFRQQGEHAFLLSYQRVQTGGFAIEVVGYGTLFWE